MAGLSRRHRNANADIWPGFVDALATLLMVIIFLLTVFVLAQFFLSDLLAGRDQALKRLESQVAELADMLALERRANTDLRGSIAQLSSQLQSSTAERDSLRLQLGDAAARADAAEADARRLEQALAAAREEVETGEETVRLKLAEIASLNSDIETLRKVRKELEAQVGQLAANLKETEAEAGSLRDRSKKLEAELADERERTLLAQKELEEETSLSEQRRDEVARLQVEISALRQELARIADALEASEAQAERQKIRIANLGQRLNAALANKVEELARYRSEFFGRLREVLGNRQDIRIVGDRFVFQSEVLFGVGEATLNPEGREQISQLAGTLLELIEKIPNDIDWILRVDGHTDVRPISTSEFPSNWELSTARALSVVRFLVREGVPPNRLVAAGFGPYQPIAEGNSEETFRRNRRIEFKLTEH